MRQVNATPTINPQEILASNVLLLEFVARDEELGVPFTRTAKKLNVSRQWLYQLVERAKSESPQSPTRAEGEIQPEAGSAANHTDITRASA